MTARLDQTSRLPAIEPLKLAWLAGLVEGEGSFIVQRGSKPLKSGVIPVYGCVQIGMTDRDVIERVNRCTGQVGRIQVEKPSDRSRATKTLYRWRLQKSLEAMDLAWRLYPFLGARRRGQVLTMWEALRAD